MRSDFRSINTAVLIAAVGAIMLPVTVFGYEENGTAWGTYTVCYKVNASAIGYQSDIDDAAAEWTAASENGFEFERDDDCTSGRWSRGYIDGWGSSYGWTVLNNQYDPTNEPPTDTVITDADTTIEDLQDYTDDQTPSKWCRDAADGSPFWDPIGCPVVNGTCTNDAGMSVACTACCTNCIQIGSSTNVAYHWDTPVAQAIALHEFGHWLWLADLTAEDEAMDWPIPTCRDLDLTSGDIDGLNELYP